MKKDFILKTKKENILRISTFEQNDDKTNLCLIYVHGFKGFKDWGFVPYIGNYFADRGFFVITFNFSHNGVGEVLTEFDELEKFAKNTISLEVEELNEVIDSYTGNYFGERKNKKIGVIGHSRGGAISILAVAQNKSVNSLAVWASVSKLDRYSEEEKASWRKTGFIVVLNSRTNQKMKLNLDLLQDIENNKNDKLSIEKATKYLNRRLLIAHGDKDTSVPFSEAKDLYSWANNELTSFCEIPGVGHTFDVVHPFSGSNPKFEMLLEKTNSFFNNYL